MRIFKNFAIALTPFILNAELVKIPEIQSPSTLLNAEIPQPISVPETPLTLNVEMSAVKQEEKISEKPETTLVQESPAAVNSEQKQSSSVEQTSVAAQVKEFSEATSTQGEEIPVSAQVEKSPVNTPVQESSAAVNSEQKQSSSVEQTSVAAQVEELPATPTPEANREEIKSPSGEEIPVSEKGQPVLVSSECKSPFHKMHVDVRHTEANGVGYQDGYTTLEGFGIYGVDSHFMPFVDVRGHIFNDGKLAGNVGVGERTYIPSINHFFGFYVYYDVRQGNHHLTVNQLSPGVEILGHRMEYRINGYFPIGRKESRSYDVQFDHFKENRMLIKKRKRFAMTGVDGEVGAHLTQSTKHDVYAGVGPYYFTAAPFSSWGGKARVFWRYREYVSLEATYSYDSLFKDVFQGTISFSYPFGPKLKRSGKNCPSENDLVLARTAFAPYRFEIPVVKRKTYRENARNSATGLPLQVWFVNNTSNSLGTYESPFPTLAQAQNVSGPNDLIYVFAGDGTTKGLDQGIVLQNGQTLYGSGNSHNYKTQQGKVLIPSFSLNSPTLTNAGSIITLASNNEVSGLNLIATQASSIAINGTSGIMNTNIHHNTISGSVDYTGVQILGYGKLIIADNQMSGNVSPANTRNGIEVNFPQNQVVSVGILNNIISGYSKGMEVTPLSNPTTATGDVVISGNSLSDFTALGIAYTTGMVNSTTKIINNTIFNTLGKLPFNHGIFVDLNEPVNAGTMIINHNNIVATTSNTNARGIGAKVDLDRGLSARMIISNNTILAGNTTGSIGIEMAVTGSTDTMCATVTNNNIQIGSGLDAMNISGIGTINIDDFSNNIASKITTSGKVNFVGPGGCSP